jgi:drug/metabolite transporter (DMT)-like permease
MSASLRLPAAITVTVLLWGSAFVGIRSALPALGFANLAAGRLVLAALTFFLLTRRFPVCRPTRAQLPLLAALGATGYAGFQLLLSAGEETVPAGTSALLFSFAPLLAIVLARPLLGERVSRRGLIGLGIAVCGVAISEGTTASEPLGGTLVLAAVVLYALWVVLQKRALRSLTPFAVTAWATWFGALFALPFAAGLPQAMVTAPPGALLTLLGLGVITTTVPFLLWTWTMSQLTASTAAPFLLLIAPATLLVGFLWLGEIPTTLGAIGGAVTLAGVALANTRRQVPRGVLDVPAVRAGAEPERAHGDPDGVGRSGVSPTICSAVNRAPQTSRWSSPVPARSRSLPASRVG